MIKDLKRISDINLQFDKWYVDVIKNADLMDYGWVKGTMIIKPYGWAIWENIQKILNKRFKSEKVQNLALPLFIPQYLIKKEIDHIRGFNPEILKVTHCGDNKLEEDFYIRPTSEALFMEFFKKEVTTYKKLPLIYNQWCSVVRWEKRTKPFLRSSEFFWQEGHTIHNSLQEAKKFTLTMLNHYQVFCEKNLAIPVFKGEKSQSEKFAGALNTYCVEGVMKNGKALQIATSHFFGDKFAKSFDIKFQNQNNKEEYGYTTSWGISTRVIGAIIMVHGDKKGLVLPPSIAPCKVILVPLLFKNKDNSVVIAKTKEIEAMLIKFDVEVDWSFKSLGFKSANAEIKGIPLRIEIGLRDLKENKITIVKRVNDQKINFDLEENLLNKISMLLEEIQDVMYQKALETKIKTTKDVKTYHELEKQVKKGFALANWCGKEECETKVKEDFQASTRCIQEIITKNEKCVVCNRKATLKIFFALAY